jgi:Zn-finger nucleic acid-binding protein
MECPKCEGVEMKVETHSSAAVARCPTCRGLFLAKGQLTKILRAGLAPEVDCLDFRGVASAMEVVPAQCPRCDRRTMDVVAGPGGVRVDRCGSCGAVFLDQGDLASIALQTIR